MQKEGWQEKWNGFINRLRTDKKFALLLYGGAIGAALLLYFLPGFLQAKTEEKSVSSQTGSEVSESAAQSNLESRLEKILSEIRGAGKVSVLVTYETAGERVAATVSTVDESISQSEGANAATKSEQTRETVEPATVSTGSGESPIILIEKEPEVRGVIVVAEGASDPVVRLNLQRAVQAVTGIPLSCIEVFEMDYPT